MENKADIPHEKKGGCNKKVTVISFLLEMYVCMLVVIIQRTNVNAILENTYDIVHVSPWSRIREILRKQQTNLTSFKPDFHIDTHLCLQEVFPQPKRVMNFFVKRHTVISSAHSKS